MRILQICNKAPYPANDGSSIAICSLAEGLADSGAELHLLAINTKKHYKPDDKVDEGFKQKTHYRSVFRNTDTSAIGALLNLFSPQSYFVSRFYFKQFGQALAETLTARQFDIVQIEGVFMASYIPLIRRLSKARITLRSHNIEHQIWERHIPHEKNGLKKWYLGLQNRRLKRFELEAFKAVDAIVTITDIDRQNTQKLMPGKPVFTCLTGVDMNKYHACGAATYPGTAFHFASMDWLPNIEAADWLMSEVWPLVTKQNRQVKLVLAGRGMPARFCKLQSAQAEVQEHVPDSTQFYRDYDVMLVPLWSGSGLRIKLVEGLAYGKPIITTSIGAEGIPYEHGKHLLIADTAQDFANAMLSLLLDPARKQALQKEARLLAEAVFDYKVQARHLIQFYKSGF